MAKGREKKKKTCYTPHAQRLDMTFCPCFLKHHLGTYSILNGFSRMGSIIHECGEIICRARLYNVMYVFLSKEQPNTG